MKKMIRGQFFVLLFGTIFAWVNFGVELAGWLSTGTCTVGCPLAAKNPFLTPCFFGALFFTISFILSALMLRKSSAKSLPEGEK